MFCGAPDLLLGLIAVAIGLVLFGLALDKAAQELSAIKRRRVSVSRLEVSDEMTFVVQSDLECDLLHTEKARLE